uniref:Putative ovule protein n=1 Tax=Solanum chacoense TaxID=4108 RepID=A0A0V0HAV0_SOLCH
MKKQGEKHKSWYTMKVKMLSWNVGAEQGEQKEPGRIISTSVGSAYYVIVSGFYRKQWGIILIKKETVGDYCIVG